MLRTTNSEQRTANSGRPALPHPQLIRRFQRRSAASADDGRAIAAGQRIADFHGADRAVEHHRGLLGWRCLRGNLHKHETVAQFSGALALHSTSRAPTMPSLARLDSRGRLSLRAAWGRCIFACWQSKFLIRAASAGSGRLPSVASRREIARLCLSSRRRE